MVVDLNTRKLFTLSEVSVELMLIIKLCWLFLPLLLSVITDWNLPGFMIMQLLVNHFIAHSDAFSNFLIKSCQSLKKVEIVLSSAKFSKLVVLNQRNRSLIKMLKKIRPNMEPWGALEKIFWRGCMCYWSWYFTYVTLNGSRKTWYCFHHGDIILN